MIYIYIHIYIYICVIVFTDCRATARFSARSRGGLRVATVGAAELRDGRGGAVRRERHLVHALREVHGWILSRFHHEKW